MRRDIQRPLRGLKSLNDSEARLIDGTLGLFRIFTTRFAQQEPSYAAAAEVQVLTELHPLGIQVPAFHHASDSPEAGQNNLPADPRTRL